MDNFSISQEFCLIVMAFKESKSLREAALKLQMDPAGLTRKVQQISNQYGFLQKVNNRWIVTSRGLELVAWTQASIQSQKKILFAKSEIRIATTMWFSEHVLIPKISKLQKSLGDDVSVSLTVPDKEFELSLVDGSVDYVMACHPPETPEIEHKQIGIEKWVLVAPLSWQKDFKSKDSSSASEILTKRPYVRHRGMNHELFLPQVKNYTFANVCIDNLIGVRSAVCEGIGWGLLPLMMAQNLFGQKLMRLPIEVPVYDRKVCVWWLRHRYDTKKLSAKIVSWCKEVDLIS